MNRLARILPFFALAACGEGDLPGNQPATADSNVTVATGSEASSPPSAARVSRFTQLDDKSCGAERIIEETGDWDRDCKGLGGYALEWSSGDLREDLAIIKGGKSTNLEIPSKVAGGAFDSLGKTVEWRGPSADAPDVMVVRVHVANAEGKNDSGRLAVVRLGSAPCIVAIVPVEAGQSERARAIADGRLPDCLPVD